MNLADSMQSQDNTIKVLFTGKRNIEYDGENIIYCLWIERYFRSQIRSINYRKKRKYVSSDNQPKIKDTWGEEDVHTSACGLKRQYKVCNFALKAETHWSLKQTCQLLVCVLRSSHSFTKRVPTAEERYVRTFSDCIPTTHNRRRLYFYRSTSPLFA